MSDIEARIERLEIQVQELSETIMAILMDDDEEEVYMLEAKRQKEWPRRVRDA